MLFLVFQLGARRYAIDASQIVEVLPLVTINKVARAPQEVAGIFVYRGAPVPVIDLSQLLEGRPAEHRLSTRVIIVHDPHSGDRRLLGLVAEKASEMIRRESTDFVDSGVRSEGAPSLGPVAPDARGLVQRLDIAGLLGLRQQAWFGQSEENEWLSPTSKTC